MVITKITDVVFELNFKHVDASVTDKYLSEQLQVMELLTSLDNFTIYDPYHYSFTHLNTNGICFQFKTSTVQLKIMLNIRDVFISVSSNHFF